MERHYTSLYHFLTCFDQVHIRLLLCAGENHVVEIMLPGCSQLPRTVAIQNLRDLCLVLSIGVGFDAGHVELVLFAQIQCLIGPGKEMHPQQTLPAGSPGLAVCKNQ